MLGITVKPSLGARREIATIRNVEAITRKSIRQAFFDLGRHLKADASREILKGKKTGRIYRIRRGRGFIRHQASAPGETHANITGKLRRSIGWKVHGARGMDFGYGVAAGGAQGQAPPYDVFVEFGTRRMEPRPSLANAIGFGPRPSNRDRDLQRDFEAAMNRALKGNP